AGVLFSSVMMLGAGPETAAEMRKARAQRQLEENLRHQERAATMLDREDLAPMDPALIEKYQSTIEYLADPAREGRSPGSHGIEQAAEFIEARFTALGLTPAFEETTEGADGEEIVTPHASFRQELQMGVSVDATVATMRVNGVELVAGDDFSVLAYSGSGEINAPASFAGYAVVSGPSGYMGFENSTTLEGRVALCLNYEPMNEDGMSKWREGGWSNHSRLTHKVSALARRNAEAVIIVSPPQADDERVDVLETIESTTPQGRGVGPGRVPKFEIPVVMVTPRVARMIVGEQEGRTLESLIEKANAGGIVEELGEQLVALNIQMARTPTMTSNLGAILEGRGTLKDEYIVVGSHYDHLGYGSFGSRIATNVGKLHPGADDNASGTSGMLIAAELITNQYALLAPNEPARSVLFLAFTAEESGLNGSRFYVDHPITEIENHAVMLNMDMIGRLENEPLEIGGLESSPGIEGFVEPFFEQSGLVIARESSVGSGRSDHASFDAAGVPAMFFFTGLHEEYHTPKDTADLIDADGGVRIAVLCSQIGYALATDPTRFEHRRNAGRQESKQPTVRVGIRPSNASKGGMMVERVFPDTSASDAGLMEYDRIIKWDGVEIESVESWRPILSKVSPGDVVSLEIERDGEIIEVEMTLRAIE
ncbi:MAG: M28 family peptidase, partial [Phycisphaerales bacterium]|nr:M28 family peptidase [Phycisphaerales bacterium]